VGWLDSILGFLSDVGAALEQVFAYLFKLIVQVFQFLWTALVDVFNFFWKIVGSIGKFLSHIWTNFFKAIWGKVLKYLQIAHRWLEAKLGPILRFLQKVRAALDRYYRLWIKPFMELLQKLRAIVLVMRLLHISFAKQLDALILRIEQQISHSFLTIRGIFTSLINVVNAVIDAPLLLRKPIMILSLRRTFYSLVRAFTGLPVSYFFPSRRSGAPRGLSPPPPGHSFLEDAYNPPASYYLGLDGGLGDFNGFDPTVTPDDSFADVVKPLDYFQEAEEVIPACTNAASCLEAHQRRVFSELPGAG
jgi:hypothetical protein